MTTTRGRKPEEKDMDTITTTVSFNRETYRLLRHRAVDEDSDVRSVVRRAVDEYLKTHEGSR
jgi:hypothetical protein